MALILLACSSGGLTMCFVFAATYGLSNGLLTIVRGTLPADLFPAIPVGTLLGYLARPALLAMAIASLCFSFVSSSGLPFETRVLGMSALALLSLLLLMAATRRMPEALLEPATAKQIR